MENIIGVTLSKKTNEMVVHCSGEEYDYNYISGRGKFIVGVLCNALRDLTSNELLLSLVDDKSLSKYTTGKSEKGKNPDFSRMSGNRILAKSWISERISDSVQPKPTIKGRRSTLYSSSPEHKEVSIEDFEVEKVIGRGSFGKVCMVKFKKTGEIFAMKSLKKDVLLDQDQVGSTILEKKILQNMNHPFLCSLRFCFQTEERIYLVMPFLEGGELFQHLRKFRVFSEEKSKIK